MSSSQKGFTLFELLAGMMVMGILFSALYVVFNRANQVSSGGEDKSELMQNLRLSLGIMSQDLETAIIQSQPPSGTDRPYLLGVNATSGAFDRDQIFFCSQTDNGIAEVGYYIRGADSMLPYQHVLHRLYTAATGGNVNYDLNFTYNSALDSITLTDFNANDELGYYICDMNIQYEYYDNNDTPGNTADDVVQTLDAWDSRNIGNSTGGTSEDDGRLPDFILVTLSAIDKPTSIAQNNTPNDTYKKSFNVRIRLPVRRGTP